MVTRVIEGEPGIFPQPIADVLRRVGRWAERGLGRRRRQEDPPPPDGAQDEP